MKFDFVDRVLTDAKDWHIPVAVGIFSIGSILQWFNHLNGDFVAFTTVVLGAVTGHAFSPAQKDKEADNDVAK